MSLGSRLFVFMLALGGTLAAAPSNASARAWPESAMATAYAAGPRVPPVPSGGVLVTRDTVDGATTTLEVIRSAARIPRHDRDLGKTRLVLRARDTQAILLDETFSELWECPGYNPRTRRYVVTSQNESGVKITLRGLVYVDESKAAFVDSIFGKVRFHAVASLYEPTGGFMALIGWKNTEAERDAGVRLYALDTNLDALVLLGAAPAPPPLAPEDRRTERGRMMMGAWEAPERHYTALGPKIWRFSTPTTLEVSYGRDTLAKRSQRRKLKRFDLSRAIAPAK